MDDQQAHDLLIRIDTKLVGMESRLERIEVAQGDRLCFTHAEKIKTLEKIVWGSVLLSLGSVVKSFWSSIGGH